MSGSQGILQTANWSASCEMQVCLLKGPIMNLPGQAYDKSSRNNRCYLSTTVGLISQNNLRMVTAVVGRNAYGSCVSPIWDKKVHI